MRETKSDVFFIHERQPLQILGVFAAGYLFEFFGDVFRDGTERRLHRFVVD